MENKILVGELIEAPRSQEKVEERQRLNDKDVTALVNYILTVIPKDSQADFLNEVMRMESEYSPGEEDFVKVVRLIFRKVEDFPLLGEK